MSEVRTLHDDKSADDLERSRQETIIPSDNTPERNPDNTGTARSGTATSHSPGRWRRRVLLTVVPVLTVLVGAYSYVQGGRFVETDNAYVKSDRVMISAEVEGVISRVLVQDNQPVTTSDVLFELQNAAFQIALDRAQAGLLQVEMDIAADRLAYDEARAQIELFRANAAFAESRLKRQEELRRSNLGTVEDLDSARHDVDTQVRQVALAEQKAARLLASLGGHADMPTAQHPRYLAALALKDEARLNLEHTQIRAPFSGIATNVPKPGNYITPGRPVMAVVADRDMWVEANFKETQLTHIKPGQTAVISIDTYPGHEWHGTVQSIAEATGAEFALLPPQNATGNWVKIVQRIPLKVVLQPQTDAPSLRMGMSATVEVDSGHTRSWHDLLPD